MAVELVCWEVARACRTGNNEHSLADQRISEVTVIFSDLPRNTWYTLPHEDIVARLLAATFSGGNTSAKAAADEDGALRTPVEGPPAHPFRGAK